MSKLGGFLFVFGVLSFVINLFGREFVLLMWIDTWGRPVGNAIRVGMIVLGLILVVVDQLRSPDVCGESRKLDRRC